MKYTLILTYYAFQMISTAFGACMDNDILPCALNVRNMLPAESKALETDYVIRAPSSEDLESFQKTLDNFDFKITTYKIENTVNYDLAVEIKEKNPLSTKVNASSQISNLEFSNANANTKISKKRKTNPEDKKIERISQIHVDEVLAANTNQIMNKVEVKNVRLLTRTWNNYDYNDKNGKFFIIKQNWIRKITTSKKK